MSKKNQTVIEKLPTLRKEVYQSNPLINARKKFGTLEARIFLLGLRGLNPHFSLKDKYYDEKFPELFIPTKHLTELLGGNTGYLHDLKNVCEKFFNVIIELDQKDGGFTLTHLFRRLDYVSAEGLHLQFDELMRPYLLDLFESKGYTKINVEQIFYLTSPYSFRLVELMLQYQNIPKFKMCQEIVREMDIEKLRFALNVPADAYNGRLDNFRRFVLDNPIAEINKKTIYQMSYKVIKRGRKIIAFEFHMDTRAVPVEDERQKYSNKAIDQLLNLGFTLKASQKILAACESEDDCLKRIAAAQKVLQKQKMRGNAPITNELGFLRSAIMKNWVPGSKRSASAQTNTSPPIPTSRKIFEENRQSKAQYVLSEMIPPPKQEISVGVQEMLIEMLADSKNSKYVDLMLKSVGWTLEEFKEKYLGKN